MESEHGADVVAFPTRERAPETDVDDTRLRDVIGEVLRDARHEQGRTLTDVADEAAVSLQYLSEVERGVKDVSSDVLRAIHFALGLDLDELLRRATQRLGARPQRRGPTLLAA